MVFIFRKINIVSQCLDVKPGTARHDRNVSAAVDSFHGFLRHRLKPGHIEFFPRLQHIDQVMRDTIHLFLCDLG